MLTNIPRNQTTPVAAFTFPEIGAAKIHSMIPTGFVYPGVGDFDATELSVGGEFSFSSVGFEDSLLDTEQVAAKAENDREMVQQAAIEKGLSEARAQIETEIVGRVGEQVFDLREQLSKTIEQVSDLAGEIASRAETELVELALDIAKKIVAREISLDREIVCSLARLALGKLHHRSAAEVRLHPKDFDYVETRRGELGFRGSLTLTADDSISPGGCLIHTETGDIDARIKSQFEEIAHGLLGS